MKRGIYILQWLVLLVSFGWMCLNLRFAYVLAEIFPARSKVDVEAISFSDNFEFAVTAFGPLVVSLIFIGVRWSRSKQVFGKN
jgi:hypothetical protein